MNLAIWVLFGIITGLIAGMMQPSLKRGSLVVPAFMGVAGALTGGFLANMFFGLGFSGLNLVSFLIAIGGALFILMIRKVIRFS